MQQSIDNEKDSIKPCFNYNCCITIQTTNNTPASLC